MKKNIITVIVPVYNTIKYLKDCLESIVNQSYRDFQIILIDDGSTDGSGNVCDEYAKLDSRIKVIHQKNAGAMNARKTGLKEADGDYIYFVDSDDWLEDKIIEAFMKIILHFSPDMILIGNKREYENGKCLTAPIPFLAGRYDKAEIKNNILPELLNTYKFYENIHIAYWNYLINRKLLLKNLKDIDDRIRILDDSVVIYPCLLDADSLYVETNFYYHYRQRGDSLTKMEDPEEYKKLQLAYEVLVNRFVQEKEKDRLLKGAKYLLLYSLLYSVSGNLQEIKELLPYKNLPKGSKVVIYGAGAFGKKLVRILKKQYNIVAWVDENFKAYQGQGILVDSPDKLMQVEYEYVILAVLKASVREDIIGTLKKRRVSSDKIIDIDLKKIDGTSLPDEFEDIVNRAQ